MHKIVVFMCFFMLSLQAREEMTLEEVSRSISEMLSTQMTTVGTLKNDTAKISKNNLLALSWHNTFCEMHHYKKECKRPHFPLSKREYKESNFVLHGLWPQPKSKIYCDVENKMISLDKHKQWHQLPDLHLSENIKQALPSLMPGFASNLHKHQWIKHGSCYGTNANRYFENAMDLLKQVNTSKVGAFFRQNIGKRVTLKQIRTVFNKSFGAGTGTRVELKCKNGLISELWLHLSGENTDLATLLRQGRKTRSQCHAGLVDKAGS